MQQIQFDQTSYIIEGERSLLSGEIHYFRVPQAEWRSRLQLLKDAGASCVATYIPWIVHEPEEGYIAFSDCPERDLTGFLQTVREMDMHAIVRPGPYCYSELVNAGLPKWLLRDYPQVLAQNRAGKPIHRFSVSYMHPLFLEKVRPWYRAVSEQLRPFVADGTVSMIQLDNECMGIHLWYGSIDFHPQTFGIGHADGLWPSWLQKSYGKPSELAEAYGLRVSSFAEVPLSPDENASSWQQARHRRDHARCYLASVAQYLSILQTWLVEDGIACTFCHNSGAMDMNALYQPVVERLRQPFLLGSDHYYALNQLFKSCNPGPLYALKCFLSMELLQRMGFPPTVFELPGGSLADTPPLLPEDLLACHMMHTAFGIRGMNFYIFTGGPNFPGTADTCDVYDYCAPVGADGSVRTNYEELLQYSHFLCQNRWLAEAELVSSVQVGIDPELLCNDAYDWPEAPVSTGTARQFLLRGVLYTLFSSHLTPTVVDLRKPLDTSKPLIVVSASTLSRTAQENVACFAQAGGRVMLAPTIPEYDENFRPCRILADCLGSLRMAPCEYMGPSFLVKEKRVYSLEAKGMLTEPPANGTVFAMEEETGAPLGVSVPVGSGEIKVFSASWMLLTFDQAQMLEDILADMGAVPTVAFSNRNVWGCLRRAPDGKTALFAMNLYSGAQETDMTLELDGQTTQLKKITLKPMEVRMITLS